MTKRYTNIDYRDAPNSYATGAELSLPMHPDGEAWKKCCCNTSPTGHKVYMNASEKFGNCMADCALTRSDILDDKSYVKDFKSFPFVCCHRHDNGFLRVCAGWHAKFGKVWEKQQ